MPLFEWPLSMPKFDIFANEKNSYIKIYARLDRRANGRGTCAKCKNLTAFLFGI